MSSVFLCHSSIDKPFARRLARDLIIRGVRIWLDEAELLVGDSLIKKISTAIAEMDYLAAILSPESVQSPWVNKELELAMNEQLKTSKIKVLPIICTECDIPNFLIDTYHLKMVSENEYLSGLENLCRRVLSNYDSDPFTPFPEDSQSSFAWVRNSQHRSRLLDIDPSIRQSVFEDIETTPLVIPVALQLLGDPSQEVASKSLEVLKSSPSDEHCFIALAGEDQSLPFGDEIVDWHGMSGTIVHYDLCWILASIRTYLDHYKLPVETLNKLYPCLDSKNINIRAISLFTLISADVPQMYTYAISLSIMEEDDLVREIATWGLAQFSSWNPDDRRVSNALEMAINDLSNNVRYQAFRGVIESSLLDLDKIISKMLTDPCPKITKLAIDTLETSKTSRAFDSLAGFLKRPTTRESYANDILLTMAIDAMRSFENSSEIETLLLDLLKHPRYSNSFERDARSARYVVAAILSVLCVHGTKMSMDYIETIELKPVRIEVPNNFGDTASYRIYDVAESLDKLKTRLKGQESKAHKTKRKNKD